MFKKYDDDIDVMVVKDSRTAEKFNDKISEIKKNGGSIVWETPEKEVNGCKHKSWGSFSCSYSNPPMNEEEKEIDEPQDSCQCKCDDSCKCECSEPCKCKCHEDEEPIDPVFVDYGRLYDKKRIITNEEREHFAEQSKDVMKRCDMLMEGDSKDNAESRKVADTTKAPHFNLRKLLCEEDENPKGDAFDSILKEMSELHNKKNADYGNAWHKEFQEFGEIIGVLRLYEKVNRLMSLYKNKGEANVKDESFEDTLIDIANYAVMTLQEMRANKK